MWHFKYLPLNIYATDCRIYHQEAESLTGLHWRDLKHVSCPYLISLFCSSVQRPPPAPQRSLKLLCNIPQCIACVIAVRFCNGVLFPACGPAGQGKVCHLRMEKRENSKDVNKPFELRLFTLKLCLEHFCVTRLSKWEFLDKRNTSCSLQIAWRCGCLQYVYYHLYKIHLKAHTARSQSKAKHVPFSKPYTKHLLLGPKLHVIRFQSLTAVNMSIQAASLFRTCAILIWNILFL